MNDQTKTLPLPRLQLTWRQGDGRSRCDYELLVPVGEFDIRDEKRRGYIATSLGGTKVEGGLGPLRPDDTLSLPFRDGAHVCWDAAALGFPAYVVFGEHVRKLETSMRPPQQSKVDTRGAQ